MKLRGLFVSASVVTSAAVFACSSDEGSSSGGGPDAAEPVCEGNLEAFRFPNGGDGSGDPFGAKAAGQARAGRIRDAAQIVQPDNARNKVRVNDFVLANDKIAVYVEAEGESDGYNPLGGDILALETVGADGRPTGVSQYNETLVMLARQTVQPEKVSVLADGADGKAAIVRVSGKLANVPFLDTFKPLIPDEYGFPAALDYVLEPGSPRLTIRLQSREHADGARRLHEQAVLRLLPVQSQPDVHRGAGLRGAEGRDAVGGVRLGEVRVPRALARRRRSAARSASAASSSSA